MTSDDLDDLTRTLGGLRVLEPDPARAERIRARCRARIVGRQQGPRSADRNTFGTRRGEAALLSGLGALYLLAVLYEVLRVPALR